ncbi:MAG: excinuclease ABC subunit C [Clostridiales bacterium]|nr:MAG: excinuclease ABC subunit C [Clostridiales bacterium]
METSKKIKEQLSKAPMSPGVYIMKDKYSSIIYVGKAKRLKNRLKSYFTGDVKSSKTRVLVSLIEEFDYIITKNEQEALLLEANLIKENKPRFNVLLKDDKNYPYVMIATNEKYPYVKRTRDIKTKAKYFGPFTSVESLDTTIEVIENMFPIRKCTFDISTVKRPCLYYHMNKCIAPCKFDCEEEHAGYIKKIMRFFEGDKEFVLDRLKNLRDEAANNLQFEKAIEYRNKIESVKNLRQYPNIISDKEKDSDYISVYSKEDSACICVLINRSGKLIDRELFTFNLEIEKSDKKIIEEFILQYYNDSSYIPSDIFVEDISDMDLISNYLGTISNRKIRVSVPKKGKKKSSIYMAKKNAEEYLRNFRDRISKEKNINEQIRIALSSIISSENTNRIEVYDISHIHGYMSVGSMVVFENFKKKKNDYRKFRIKNNNASDDLASIREILSRRMERLNDLNFAVRPDIIIVDGGFNQVKVAEEVIQNYNQDIPVIGLAKDSRHRTKSVIYDGSEYELDKSSDIYRFFYKVQEEVHRFAIEYHKKLMGKSIAFKLLDEIDGVGKVRKKELMKKFGSIEKIKNASLEELLEVDGMNVKVSRSVYEYFRKG